MALDKDSSEVVKFMNLLAQLKIWSDNDPASLAVLAKEDEGVKDLCVRLWGAAHFLTMNECRRRELFATPVDPKFLAAWRDYEDRFAKPLAGIWLADLSPDFGPSESEPVSGAELNWEYADHDGANQGRAIETAIEFAREQVTDFPEEFWEAMEDAAAAWERLRDDVGFDLRGVFRRRELVPFVLIPRHVAAKQGGAGVPSMLKNLQQAHRPLSLAHRSPR